VKTRKVLLDSSYRKRHFLRFPLCEIRGIVAKPKFSSPSIWKGKWLALGKG
jgi:hypothetical protein